MPPRERRLLRTDPTAGSCAFGREADCGELRDAICAAVASSCLRCFGDRLRSAVLTGSMSRGEATFVWKSNYWQVLGDAEFFLVFQERQSLPGTRQMDAVKQEIARTLMNQAIRCPVDLSPVHPNYLKGLPPHILAYELKQCGQVVWGDANILALIPRFAVSDIPLEDAWRLLSNRMVEYLEVATDLTLNLAASSPNASYLTAKLYLDMATSLLLFVGAYEPTYRMRAEQLRQLAAALPPGLRPPFPLDDFAKCVDACTAYKLQSGKNRDIDPAPSWKEAVEYARRLWNWELRELTRLGAELSDDNLIREWMRRQSLMGRLRGWVRVFRDAGWRGNWIEWPRWLLLARQASPRHWIYAAGAEILFRLPSLMDRSDRTGADGFDFGALCRWLPLRSHSRATESGRPWFSAATAVVSNYRRFVAVTRA